MRTMSVREFKEHANEVVSDLEETREEVRITRNRRVVARMVPARHQMTAGELAAWNADMDKLARKIADLWNGPLDAGEVMAAERER